MARLHNSLLVYSMVGLFAATCGGSVDVESSGSGASGGAGAQGGTTSTGMTAAGGSASTASAMSTSSSSSGTPCSEQPCKLVAPQCGCAPGDKCMLDDQGARICAPEGMDPVGAACGDCVAGSQCLSIQGIGICRAFCDSDEQCDGPGGLCVLEINDGMGGTWDATFCSDNCDPISSSGCAPAGSKCTVSQQNGGTMSFFTLCAGAGSGTQGSPCNATGDCAAGYECLNAGMAAQCLRWCTPNNPQCPGGTICNGFPSPLIIGALEYGVCL